MPRFCFKISDVIDQAQHEGVDILAVPLGGGTGPYPDAYSVVLKVKKVPRSILGRYLDFPRTFVCVNSPVENRRGSVLALRNSSTRDYPGHA